jgi:hypothetical protein
MEDGMKNKLLFAAILAAAATSPVPAVAWPEPYIYRKRKPPVKRMVSSSSDEIKAWNAAVDAKKKAQEPKQ